jgi:hypothetical protein
VASLLRAPDEERAEAELELIRERSLRAVEDYFELERAERALSFNPRRRAQRVPFQAERGRLASAARQYRHLRSIARMAADAAGVAEPERLVLAEELERLRETGDAETVDPGTLKDPRAIGLAVKLAQMAKDLRASE